MGIESTVAYPRSIAISRIKEIAQLILDRDYRKLEAASSEFGEYDIEAYVDEKQIEASKICADNLGNWTDGMLKARMDWPFFRLSKFDKYSIEGD